MHDHHHHISCRKRRFIIISPRNSRLTGNSSTASWRAKHRLIFHRSMNEGTLQFFHWRRRDGAISQNFTWFLCRNLLRSHKPHLSAHLPPGGIPLKYLETEKFVSSILKLLCFFQGGRSQNVTSMQSLGSLPLLTFWKGKGSFFRAKSCFGG